MSQRRADVVIVGAGGAGCVLARRLGDRDDRDILLLEAGPDPGRAETAQLTNGWRLPTLPDWGYASDAAEPRPLRRGRALGGTSWFTRFAVRGAAADFDAWAAAGNPGWAWDDVQPAFRAIEADAEFGDEPWHGGAGPLPVTRYPELARHPIHEAAVAALERAGFVAVADHNAPDAVGVGPMPMSTRNGTRVTSWDAWLGGGASTGRPARLEIRPESPVDRVLVRSGRAAGVRLVDGTEIGAALVILAAGTYGSPLLLLRSGIGPPDELTAVGIDPILDLPGVGANLADHVGAEVDLGWTGAPIPDGPILHSIATFRSPDRADGAPDVLYWLSDPFGDEPAFSIETVLMKPVARGRVRIVTAEPAGPPRITLPDPTIAADFDRITDAWLRSITIANDPELRGLVGGGLLQAPTGPTEIRRRIDDSRYSLPHVVGTCRMGPDPLDGAVVDTRCRVHGIEGLVVADASVIPEPPAGFPHVIVLMLAERVAAMLA